MRLIDADALIPSEVHTVVVRKADGKEVWESVLYAEQIDNAPTVDAVPVVRCKDCIYYHPFAEIKGMGECYLDEDAGYFPWYHDCEYCSYGERREDETD